MKVEISNKVKGFPLHSDAEGSFRTLIPVEQIGPGWAVFKLITSYRSILGDSAVPTGQMKLPACGVTCGPVTIS